MPDARLATVLVAQMEARIGLAADVAEVIGEAGVNLQAISAYELEGAGDFVLVTDDPTAARAALEAFGAEVREDSAVSVDLDDDPGAMRDAARAIADAGINVECVFGSSCARSSATVVFKTSDDEGALEALGY